VVAETSTWRRAGSTSATVASSTAAKRSHSVGRPVLGFHVSLELESGEPRHGVIPPARTRIAQGVAEPPQEARGAEMSEPRVSAGARTFEVR
jgi:hypothetical protein